MTSRFARTLSAAALALFAGRAGSSAQASRAVPVEGRSVRFAGSANVRDLPAASPDQNPTLPAEWIRDNDRLPRAEGPFPEGDRPDPTLRQALAAPLSPAMPGPTGSFAGISADEAAAVGGRFAPPDTVGDVGPNHYVQAVNTVLRVYDKSGAPLTPLVSLGTFFGPLGTNCSGQFGDPIVLYDPLADRWLISQFGLPHGFQPPFHQCVAISQTSDPTGSFYLYDFLMPNKVNDYPHFGVWPDGYYMSDNQFTIGGGSFAGAGLLAFDRSKMLVGDPTAGYIYFDYFPTDPNAGGLLPSDLDGLTPPPPGTPNILLGVPLRRLRRPERRAAPLRVPRRLREPRQLDADRPAGPRRRAVRRALSERPQRHRGAASRDGERRRGRGRRPHDASGRVTARSRAAFSRSSSTGRSTSAASTRSARGPTSPECDSRSCGATPRRER